MSEILWIAYLGLIGAPAIGFLLKGKYKTVVMKIDFLVSVTTWTGLFGYVTSIPIGDALIWKIVFFVGILWDLIFVIFLDHSDEKMEGISETTLKITTVVFSIIILLPLYYGVYRYAFHVM
ncbi:hypothetical protein [Guptibacillus hwajinpoensis]|uniref:Uncharacterized membrane protein YtjA (UPF0391 family) n=1 Tax=Guptibacillus hwajinpoensis TaxID=208199 RepID=A0ABU0K861_9BACL|nr:hypothetical protein [Alkalihalobacillus hemicentroti]MDQ0484523.1 uncharacterized membrane protein YtjA (UPF0391 family) [Alkalihalobacillus hemicentroti]